MFCSRYVDTKMSVAVYKLAVPNSVNVDWTNNLYEQYLTESGFHTAHVFTG